MTIRRYRAPQYAPQNTHLKNVVKGSDRYYRIGPRRPLWRSYAVLIAILLLAVFGTLAVVAGVAK